MKPPSELDGARVLWWAWSGETPFGELRGGVGDDRWVHGFAIGVYESGSVYRFSCNRHWEVVQDMDVGPGESVEDAKHNLPMNYDGANVCWRAFEGD